MRKLLLIITLLSFFAVSAAYAFDIWGDADIYGGIETGMGGTDGNATIKDNATVGGKLTVTGEVVGSNIPTDTADNSSHYLSADGTWSAPAGSGGGGDVSISGTPVANDYARWTDNETIEGRSYGQAQTDLDFANIEGSPLGTYITRWFDDNSITGSSTATLTGSGSMQVVDLTLTGDLTMSGIMTTSGTTVTFPGTTTGIEATDLDTRLDGVKDGTDGQVLAVKSDNATTEWVDAGAGTVTSVGAGAGMSFSPAITVSGNVVMGTPTTIDNATSNSVGTGTHAHELDVSKVLATDLNVSGTPSTLLFLRGDNAWETPAGGGNVSAETSPAPTTTEYALWNSGTVIGSANATVMRTYLNVDNGSTANVGTVTSVGNGNGMNFTTFTDSGTVTLGTPGTVTAESNNGVQTAAHTHELDESGITVTTSNFADFAGDVAATTAVTDNTAKDTNVDTDLSNGARDNDTYQILSSDGNDVTMVEADTDNSGLLSAEKWDEIVANTLKLTNYTHTGEATGNETLTIASDIVDEDNLDISNGGINDYVLTYDNATGGDMKWSAAGAGTVTTSGSPLASYVPFFSGATAITGTDNATLDNLGNMGLEGILTIAGTATSIVLANDHEIINTGLTDITLRADTGRWLEFELEDSTLLILDTNATAGFQFLDDVDVSGDLISDNVPIDDDNASKYLSAAGTWTVPAGSSGTGDVIKATGYTEAAGEIATWNGTSKTVDGSSNLTFDGTDLTLTGNAVISGNITAEAGGDVDIVVPNSKNFFVELSTADGSTEFSLTDNASAEVASIDSDGNLKIDGDLNIGDATAGNAVPFITLTADDTVDTSAVISNEDGVVNITSDSGNALAGSKINLNIDSVSTNIMEIDEDSVTVQAGVDLVVDNNTTIGDNATVGGILTTKSLQITNPASTIVTLDFENSGGNGCQIFAAPSGSVCFGATTIVDDTPLDLCAICD